MASAKSVRRILTIFKHTKHQNGLISSVTAHVRKMSSFAEDDVLFERVGGAGIVTLNRPSALNALNLSMIRKISPMIEQWETDPSTTMIIMKGAGNKAFCAGGDVKSITDAAKSGDYEAGQEFFAEEYQLNYKIANCHVPYIALIDGITMGGGVGLSVHGMERVCTERTVFAMPETAIGLFPDVGGSYFLPRLSAHLGMFLALTGYRLKGRDVYKAGVATRMVHSNTLPYLEKELVSLDSPTPQDITNVLRKYHLSCDTGRERDYLILRDVEGAIRHCFTANTVEEIFQNLEKDGSDWAQEQLKILNRQSPTSLKVTHRQLVEGAKLHLDECLEMEFRIGSTCLRGSDFPEGVRAAIVDKDRNPTWNPKTLSEVTPQMVDSFFAPTPGVEDLNLHDDHHHDNQHDRLNQIH